MRKILIIFMAAVVFLYPGSALAGGTEVSSNDLIEHAKEYDGQTVAYVGEVIGDVMIRGEYAWINVYDGSNAIGVWVKKSDAQKISYLGGYNAHGDTVKITGVFHRACAEHGGDLDIHADSIEMIQQGYAVDNHAKGWKAAIAVTLLSGAAVCMLFVKRSLKQ